MEIYMKNKRKSSKRQEGEATFMTCMKSSALATVYCSLSAIVLLVIFAAISLCFEDPLSVARYSACSILFLTAFACGIVSRTLCRSYTIPCGIISGGLLFVLTLAAYFIYKEGDNSVYGILVRLALPLMSVLGAFATSYKRQKRHRRKRF